MYEMNKVRISGGCSPGLAQSLATWSDIGVSVLDCGVEVKWTSNGRDREIFSRLFLDPEMGIDKIELVEYQVPLDWGEKMDGEKEKGLVVVAMRLMEGAMTPKEAETRLTASEKPQFKPREIEVLVKHFFQQPGP